MDKYSEYSEYSGDPIVSTFLEWIETETTPRSDASLQVPGIKVYGGRIDNVAACTDFLDSCVMAL